MSAGVLALLVGTVLAVGALAFVLYPLFFDESGEPGPPAPPPVAKTAGATDDDIEARIRAYREARRQCPRCGLRPERDASYCSSCGDYLGDPTD